MDFLDDGWYELDDRGLSGYDRQALDFVSDFLDKLQQSARVYRLSGNDVMLLNQTIQVVCDFMKVNYDGSVRISALREDGIGIRSSVLEITPRRILIGVTGRDTDEMGGDPYSDPYFIIGAQDENNSLEEDLAVWEEEFFQKLTYPDGKVLLEGEIQDVREEVPDEEQESDNDWNDLS